MAVAAPGPVLRDSAAARRFLVPALAAVGLLIADAFVAGALVDPRLARIQLVAAAVIGLVLVFRFPLLATGVVFVLVDFIFHGKYFDVAFRGQHFQPYELILAILFVIAVVRPRRRTWGGGIGLGLACFAAMLVLSAALAIGDGRTTGALAFAPFRGFAPLALFWVIVRLFPDRRTVEKLLGVGVILAAVSGFLAIPAALGASFANGLQDPSKNVIHNLEGMGLLLRIRFPGEDLAYALFWVGVVFALRAARGRRWFWLAVILGCTANVIISFWRTQWIGLIVTFVMLLVLADKNVRRRLVTGVATLTVGFVILIAVGGQVGSNSPVYPLLARATSVLHPKTLAENNTVGQRVYENKVAWPVAKHHILTGVGLGAPFGVFGFDYTGFGSQIAHTRGPQTWMHDQYLYLWLVAGLPGAIAFLAAFVAAILRSWKSRPTDHMLVACGLGLVAILISSVTIIDFSVPDYTAVIALLLGSVYVLSTPWRTPGAPPAPVRRALAPPRPSASPQPAPVGSR